MSRRFRRPRSVDLPEPPRGIEPQTYALREIRSSPPRCSPSPSVHVKRFTVHSGRPPYDLISCHEPCHDGDQERLGGLGSVRSARTVDRPPRRSRRVGATHSVCVVLMFETPAHGRSLRRISVSGCVHGSEVQEQQCEHQPTARGFRKSAGHTFFGGRSGPARPSFALRSGRVSHSGTSQDGALRLKSGRSAVRPAPGHPA